MAREYVRFFAPESSEEFKLLCSIADIHKTARQKHIDLLRVCAGKGVAFKDIRAHLLNEAKRSGLWDGGKPEHCVVDRAWYVAVANFVVWTKKHFTDYNTPREQVRVNKVPAPLPPRELIIRRQEIPAAGPTITQPTVSQPAVTVPPVPATKKKQESSKTTVEKQSEVFNTADTKLEMPVKKADEVGKKTESLIDPVNFGLTKVQMQQIIFCNLGLLAEQAKRLGAGTEWNLLMDAMGLDHECIDLSDELIPESRIAEQQSVSAN